LEKIVGIIVGAGKSKRFGNDKLLENLEGKPIIYYSINTLGKIAEIDEIILVAREENIPWLEEKLIEWDFNKVSMIVAGGEERQESVYNGLKSINGLCEFVLIHDAARPLVSSEKVKGLINFCIKNRVGGVLGTPVKDTIKLVDEHKKIKSTLERNKLWSIRTPQMFPYSWIIEAHERARRDNFLGTDDAVLLERLGYSVYIVEDDFFNIKLTTKEDLLWMEWWLQKSE